MTGSNANPPAEIATSFVEMAHRIVYCTVATTDRVGRPRSRVLHPFWEWDGEALSGSALTYPTPLKRAHLEGSPYASCSYWLPDQDSCIAECRASLSTDEADCARVWGLFSEAPAPVGYDPTMIPDWKDGPGSEALGVLSLKPWRLRIFDGAFMLSGGAEGRLLTWSDD